jgi:hypothetical protein
MKKGRKKDKKQDIDLFAELIADLLLQQIVNNKPYGKILDRKRVSR